MPRGEFETGGTCKEEGSEGGRSSRECNCKCNKADRESERMKLLPAHGVYLLYHMGHAQPLWPTQLNSSVDFMEFKEEVVC